MKNITITTQELPNLIKLGQQFHEKLTYKTVKSGIRITASIIFLTSIGY